MDERHHHQKGSLDEEGKIKNSVRTTREEDDDDDDDVNDTDSDEGNIIANDERAGKRRNDCDDSNIKVKTEIERE